MKYAIVWKIAELGTAKWAVSNDALWWDKVVVAGTGYVICGVVSCDCKIFQCNAKVLCNVWWCDQAMVREIIKYDFEQAFGKIRIAVHARWKDERWNRGRWLSVWNMPCCPFVLHYIKAYKGNQTSYESCHLVKRLKLVRLPMTEIQYWPRFV